MVAEYGYDPYGKPIIESITQSGNNAIRQFSFPLRFQSKYYDSETGLYYFGYRYYDPASCKWLCRDPLQEQGGINLTAYCNGDPVNKFDPLGLAVGDEWDPRTQGTRIIGFGIGLWGQVEGCYQMGRHPIETAKGMATALWHPIETYEGIKQMVDEELNKAGASTTEMLLLEGRVTAEIATMFIGVGEVAALAKGGKIANALNKARLAARTSIAAKLSKSRALTTMANVTSKVVSGVDNQVSSVVRLSTSLTGVGATVKMTDNILLSGEGAVGIYDDLIALGSKGDNLTPHHIPSAKHMASQGVSRGDGVSIMMEQPFPGVGGRHRRTFNYGTSADVGMASRDALAAGIRDVRGIYMQDDLYTPYIRQQLQEMIRQNKNLYPSVFSK